MERRQFFATSVTAALGLSGCIGDSDETSTGEPRRTEGNSEPTVRNTDTAHSNAEKLLSFGEWWTNEWFAYTVLSVETSKTFYDDFEKNQEMQMPDGKQLLFADLEVKNVSQEAQRTGMVSFGAIFGDDYYEATGSFDHPKYTDNKVDMDWLKKTNQKPRLQFPTLGKIESGQKKSYWVGFVIPAEYEASNATIGYDLVSDGLYEIRWKQ